MGRYPSRNGLALHPQELGFEIVEPKHRLTNNHHRYFCGNAYRERIPRLFRGLETHVHTLLIPAHSALHRQYPEPVMPKEWQMVDVLDEYMTINGVLNVIRESKTNESYQIQPEQWQRIRDGKH